MRLEHLNAHRPPPEQLPYLEPSMDRNCKEPLCLVSTAGWDVSGCGDDHVFGLDCDEWGCGQYGYIVGHRTRRMAYRYTHEPLHSWFTNPNVVDPIPSHRVQRTPTNDRPSNRLIPSQPHRISSPSTAHLASYRSQPRTSSLGV